MPHGDVPPRPAAAAPAPDAGAPPWLANTRQGATQSPGGGITVRTTERGLPTALKLAPGELKKPPQQLAREILALCKLSAMRLQVEHRRELVEQGRSALVIRDFRLATEEELAEATNRLEEESLGGEDQPKSWMRPV